jgi:cell division septum initiation protein DivIVA
VALDEHTPKHERAVAREPEQQDDSARPFLAPADLRSHSLPSQAALGFHRGSTEELLGRAADTIERLQRELLLAQEAKEVDRLERSELNASLEEATKRAELLVGETMVEAHKAGQALKAEAEADAEKLRTEAEALLEPARQEAARLMAEAQQNAERLVNEAKAECDRLATEAEQYKLLAADVQQRSIEFLERGLEALGSDPAAPEVGEERSPFRSAEQEAAGVK